MIGKKIIDGNSRLFQVLVLITVASVLLVAAAGINEAGDSNSGVKYTVDGEDNEEYMPAISVRGSGILPSDSGGERSVDESGGEKANHDGSTTISLNSVYYRVIGGLLIGLVVVSGFVLYKKNYGVSDMKRVVIGTVIKFIDWLFNVDTNIVAHMKNGVKLITNLRNMNVIGKGINIFQRVRNVLLRLMGKDNVSTSNSEGGGGVEKLSEMEMNALDKVKWCWRVVVKRVLGSTGETTKTTVELRESAINKGLPRRYVEYIQSSFTDVVYGKKPPENSVDGIEKAVDEINENTNTDITNDK